MDGEDREAEPKTIRALLTCHHTIRAVRTVATFHAMQCPACGEEATGRFCSGCGATLTALRCPSCDAEVSPGARFCHLCGRGLGSDPGRKVALSWILAGATVTALAAVLLVRLTSPSSALAGGADGSANDGPGGMAPAPDISAMPPRERADRLFNRVMSAAERGDTNAIRFFTPMAVQAYSLLGALDPDARYHLGMIDLIGGGLAGATAQADSIARASPTHLLGSVLRAEIATRRGDAAARERAYRDLLRNYDREMATGKSEYADHRTVLESTRDQARRAIAGSK